MKNKLINTRVTFGKISGKFKMDEEKMVPTIWNAWEILSDLKKIHAKVASRKVSSIDPNSLTEGNVLSNATISIFERLVFEIIEGKINKAFKNPQKIKVQFAPCQNPLTTKIINVFLIFFQTPTLLPPNGI